MVVHVYESARWACELAGVSVLNDGTLLAHVFQAVFADVEHCLLAILFGVRTEVPSVDFIVSKEDFLNVSNLSGLLMSLF